MFLYVHRRGFIWLLFLEQTVFAGFLDLTRGGLKNSASPSTCGTLSSRSTPIPSGTLGRAQISAVCAAEEIDFHLPADYLLDLQV